MSKIRELTNQIATIPDKERRKNQVGSLEATRDKLRMLTAIANGAAEVCMASTAINGANFVSKAHQGIVQAGASAKQLNAHLTKGGAIAGNKRADELLTQVSERISAAASAVQRGWVSVVQVNANRYEPLAEVARKLGLPGAPGLDRALSQVRRWEGSPPTTAAGAEDFSTAIAQVRGSVESLGFKGKADAFMIAAAAGAASARDLLDPDVVAFLNENPAIWGLLQVKLR